MNNSFDWKKVRQLSIPVIFLAFFAPSAFAFTGFRFVLPILVHKGLPSILAWPLTASVMLLSFVIIAIVLLTKEAKSLQIPLFTRMCLMKLSGKQWLGSLAILAIGLVVTMTLSGISVQMVKLPGLSVPDYFPFFLNPQINPMKTDLSLLTPGFTLKGAYFLIPLIIVTLFLNILTEELYFRAYLLPKLSNFKKLSWLINGFLFALYHTFQLWLLPQILPVSLFLAFIVYKYKSIWPAFAFHLLTNTLTVLAMVYLIIS